ncbi:MAG: cobalt transporter [Bacillota bacterium]|nr:cobalt transporter [Bacillota bacterium]
MNTINPSVKALGLLMPTFFLAAMQKPFLNLTVFVLSLILLAVSRINYKIFIAAMIPVILTALGTFYTGYRFQAGNGMPVSELSFHLADSGVWNGLILASRVLAFAGLGLLLALTTDRVRLVQSLNQQLKLPPVFAYGLLAAWGILPVMMREYRQTRAAFRARGLRVLPVSPALLKPMLVKAVRWAEALSVAMESKGFDGNAPRTVYRPVPVRIRDFIFLFAVALGCAGILFLP